jgi:hypothetical protein
MADLGENASLADKDGPLRFWGRMLVSLGFDQVRKKKITLHQMKN